MEDGSNCENVACLLHCTMTAADILQKSPLITPRSHISIHMLLVDAPDLNFLLVDAVSQLASVTHDISFNNSQ